MYRAVLWRRTSREYREQNAQMTAYLGDTTTCTCRCAAQDYDGCYAAADGDENDHLGRDNKCPIDGPIEGGAIPSDPKYAIRTGPTISSEATYSGQVQRILRREV